MSEISEIGERHDDQEFDAFLQGQDALSRELRALPQTGPSKALDAAILLKIETALAEEARLKFACTGITVDATEGATEYTTKSATEATPTPTSSKPSFFFRVFDGISAHLKSLWLIPLGLAAGVIFTLTIKSYYEQENIQNMPNAMTAQLSKNHASKALAASDQKIMGNTASESIAKETASAIPPASNTVIALQHVTNATSKKRKEASPAATERPSLVDLDKPMPLPSAAKDNEIQRVTVTGSSVKRIESEGSLTVVTLSTPESKPVSKKTAANNDATMIALQRQDQTTMGRSGQKVSVLADKATNTNTIVYEESSYRAKADYATKQNTADTRATTTHNVNESVNESVNDNALKNAQGNIALPARKLAAISEAPASPKEATIQLQKQISENMTKPAPTVSVAPIVPYPAQVLAKVAPIEEASTQRARASNSTMSSSPKSETEISDHKLKAERWLELISRKLAQGDTRAALQEWKQFKLNYPAFVVPVILNEKIKAAHIKEHLN
jgi:hypothetical protein